MKTLNGRTKPKPAVKRTATAVTLITVFAAGVLYYAGIRPIILADHLIAAIESNRQADAINALNQGAPPNAGRDATKGSTWVRFVNSSFRRQKLVTGPSALELAVAAGQTLVVQELLNRGAKLVPMVGTGTPLLSHAVNHRQSDIAMALLDHGAKDWDWIGASTHDLDVSRFEGIVKGMPRRCIVEAALYLDERVLLRMLKAGAKWYDSGERNDLLPAIAFRGWMQSAELIPAEAFRWTEADSNGGSIYPVYMAAAGGHADMIRVLLAHGMNVDGPHTEGPLHVASELGHIEAVRALVGHGAKVNKIDRFGTPIVKASDSKHWDIVVYLLDHGAKPDIEDYGLTALGGALRAGNVKMVELLIKRGANPNHDMGKGRVPILTAAESGFVDCVRVLLDHGADVNDMGGPWSLTPLKEAVGNDRYDVAKYLISRGADVNLTHIPGGNEVRSSVQSPLEIAYGKKNQRMIELLKKAGAKR